MRFVILPSGLMPNLEEATSILVDSERMITITFNSGGFVVLSLLDSDALRRYIGDIGIGDGFTKLT